MRCFKVIVLINFFWVTALAFGGDPLENLIDKEKQVDPQWILSDQDLPPVFLLGDSNSVLIYSPEMEDDSSPSLCSNVSWEELTDETQRKALGAEYEINFLSPRIRDKWARMCLVRPGDELMAIGRGEQKRVAIRSFVLRPHINPCEDHVEMEIRALLKDPLPPDPLFYSSDPSLVEGDNQYHSLSPSTNAALIELAKQILNNKIEFFSDFSTDFLLDTISSSSQTVVAHLRRMEISSDDIGLSHDIVAVIQSDQAQILNREKISRDQQTGRVESIDGLDFDRDGYMDLVLEGDHSGCFFRRFFIGSPDRYNEASYPRIDCQCQ